DTTVAHRVIGLDAVVGAELDVVVVNVDAHLVERVLALHRRDAVAEVGDAVEADDVAGAGHLDAFALIFAVGPHRLARPRRDPLDDVIGDVAVGRPRGPGGADAVDRLDVAAPDNAILRTDQVDAGIALGFLFDREVLEVDVLSAAEDDSLEDGGARPADHDR